MLFVLALPTRKNMEPPLGPKSRWTLTRDAFDLLLAQLDADRQAAGTKYEVLRRKLIKFFEWRGCSFPEDLADNTLNRVARSLETGEKIHNLTAYCVGVARRVVLESLRARQYEREAHRSASDSRAQPTHEADQLRECLERCLQKLSPDNLDLILKYYQEDRSAKIEARRDLAAQLGIPLNALRIRAHRIRVRLEDCVQDCMNCFRKKGNELAESSL